jgi:hypothetical protein
VNTEVNVAGYAEVRLSLKTFGYLADKLKMEYFNMPVNVSFVIFHIMSCYVQVIYDKIHVIHSFI